MSDLTPAETVLLCLGYFVVLGVCFGLAKTRAAKAAGLVLLGVGAVILAVTAFGGGS